MAHDSPAQTGPHGVMAEFDSAQALLDAAQKTTAAGYTKAEAYSPFPIHGLADALNFRERKIAPIIFMGAITGTAAGYGLEYWTSVIDYPMNIGGRPFHAWVSFIPVAFELTILFGAFAAVFGMLALNGLPQPYHPVFNHPRFSLASQDRFFLVIERADPKFETERAKAFLAGLHPREVVVVED